MGLLHWITPCHCNTLQLIRVSHCIKYVWVVPQIVWSLPFSPFSPCTQAFVCLCVCMGVCLWVWVCVPLGCLGSVYMCVSGSEYARLYVCACLWVSLVPHTKCMWMVLSNCVRNHARVCKQAPCVCCISHCTLSIACGGQSCLNYCKYCKYNLQYVVVRVAVCNGEDHWSS